MVQFLENKNNRIKHASGKEKDFTIFDALLDSMIQKENKESMLTRFSSFVKSPWNVAGLFLLITGLTTLMWTGEIFLKDITVYGKDVATILLATRVGENISLGIDMRLIYYVLIGLELVALNFVVRIIKSKGQD